MTVMPAPALSEHSQNHATEEHMRRCLETTPCTASPRKESRATRNLECELLDIALTAQPISLPEKLEPSNLSAVSVVHIAQSPDKARGQGTDADVEMVEASS